jgi:chromosome segregation ATPase
MLAHRQTEAAELEAKIEEALQVSQELRRVLAGVEMEEDMVRARLSRLRGDLAEIMAEIEARSGVSLKGPKRANLRVAPAE